MCTVRTDSVNADRSWQTRLLIASPFLVQLLLSLGPLLEERWEGDAGLVAAISAKAAREDHWWTLWLSAEPYFNKPPLAFWLHGGLIKLFGPETWALKLPEVAAVLLTLVAIQCIFTRLASIWVGVLGGLLFATSRSISFLIDTLRHDYVHNALLLWGVWFVVSAVFAPPDLVIDTAQRKRRTLRLLLLSGLCVGGAMMVKPFWALGAYPILAIWLTIDRHRPVDGSAPAARDVSAGRSFRVIGSPQRIASRLWIAALAAICTAAPWHLAMLSQHGDAFYQQYFRKQALDRVLSDKFTAEPWWWYLDYYRESCLPLVVLMGLGLILGVPLGLIARRASSPRRTSTSSIAPHSGWPSAALLGLLWVVLWTLVLSLAQDKRRNYVLHIIPFMAMLGGLSLAGLLAILRDVADRAGAQAVRVVLATIATASLVTAIGFNFYAMRPWILSEPIGNPKSELGRLVRVLQGKGRAGPGPHMRSAIDFITWANEPVYVGRFRYNDSAIIYIKSGIWPKSHGWGGSPWKRPPRGSLVLFDVSNNDFIPKRDVVVFRSGHIVITRRGWALHPPEDSGETQTASPNGAGTAAPPQGEPAAEPER